MGGLLTLDILYNEKKEQLIGWLQEVIGTAH